MKKSDIERMRAVELRPSSPLRTSVWRIRRSIRNILGGRDVLDVESRGSRSGLAVKRIYKKADEFTSRYFPSSVSVTKRAVATARLRDAIAELDYDIVEANEDKPWGSYYRLDSKQADRFIAEFFPGLDPVEARLGNPKLELSPKFLLVAPGQRLSWQLHHRRAERWRFLSKGAYYRSLTDEPGDRQVAEADHVVQFAREERHRLCAFDDTSWTLVAEIWQHTDAVNSSDEDDIVRLQDDYSR